jgi:hypothetical protein
MIFSALGRGMAAGAAGTAALNAATYVDMALRARPASDIPKRTVDQVAAKAGTSVPGEGEQRDNRLEGIGALSGIATGVGVGAAVGLLGPLLDRLPRTVSALTVGALAMAAGNLPTINLGLSDPKQWSAADWASDAIPHVAYGVVTSWTLRALRGSRA